MKAVLLLVLIGVFSEITTIAAQDDFCTGKPDGDYAHPETCSGFISCSNGITYDMSCPSDLWWNDEKGWCDYPESSTECPENFELKFPRSGTTDYVIYSGVPSMQAVTVCFWVKTDDEKNDGTPFSYAVPEQHNELIIYNYKGFTFLIKGYSVQTSVTANDGKWHHICLTWENTAGSWVLYKDGQAAANGYLQKGSMIYGGGTITLGQEQDSVGGDFEAFQSFIGELTGVYLWNKALDQEEISKLSAACPTGDGNVFNWRDAIAGIHGDVEVVKPSTCMELE